MFRHNGDQTVSDDPITTTSSVVATAVASQPHQNGDSETSNQEIQVETVIENAAATVVPQLQNNNGLRASEGVDPLTGDAAFAQALKYARITRGWDQKTLAEKMSESGQKFQEDDISEIENGSKTITQALILIVSSTFGMDEQTWSAYQNESISTSRLTEE